jgi:hypothetical protein
MDVTATARVVASTNPMASEESPEDDDENRVKR